MKTFTIYCELARQRGAIGIFEPIARQYYAEDPAAAEALYQSEIETNGPPLHTKEIPNPFDAEGLENYANNTETIAQHVRRLVESLRREMDRTALAMSRWQKDWHDDTEAEDHPLFQASEDVKYPRETRDAAILELVKTHLQVITENEVAAARRFEKETNGKL